MAKKTYQELLKENLSEFDTTKTVDVKGPMLDPILGYEGDGELPTYKDAASVLERYYFGEKRKEDEISEMDYENDKGDSKGESMKNTKGPEGEQQAGTSDADTAQGAEKEKEKDIAKESKEAGKEAGKVVSEKEMNASDLKSKEMKDADGPEGEEQAGTGNTYTDFKKRVVEAIEDIVDTESLIEKDEEEEKDEKKEGDDKEEKDEKKEGDDKEEKEEMKEDAGVGAGPLPALAAKAKSDNKEGDEEEEYDDAKGKGKDVKEGDEIELTPDTEDITESLENEIIEKLISEMEEESEVVKDEEEVDTDKAEKKVGEDEEEEEEGLDVDKQMEEMVNRLTQGHAEGPEGEEQAGTGGEEKVIPPRKDKSNEGTKEKGTKSMDKSELADA